MKTQTSAQILNKAVDYIRSLKQTGPGYANEVQSAVDHAEQLAEALKTLFRECAMVHKYWGDGCNQAQADAAVTKASEALAAWEGAQK